VLSPQLAFFRETRHTFGRTALLLSGGGSYGTYHFGICKALFEQHMLPRVMAGSSAGSIGGLGTLSETKGEGKGGRAGEGDGKEQFGIHR
jgi:predicted acylesterase/phospholipase RssA